MNSGIAALEQAYHILFLGLLIILALLFFSCLIRAVVGPRMADRIVAINMMGTITMVIIAILAVRMNEGYLVDICIIYAMISFLAVTLLTKVYMGIYAEYNQKRGKKQEKREDKTDDRVTVD